MSARSTAVARLAAATAIALVVFLAVGAGVDAVAGEEYTREGHVMRAVLVFFATVPAVGVGHASDRRLATAHP